MSTSKRTPKAPTKSGEFPERLGLPSPIELAKIAAAFVPTNDDDRDACSFYLDAAIKEAAKLYLRTQRFCHEHQNDSLEKLADAVGDDSLYLQASLARMKGRILRLEIDKRNDTARHYLAEHGLHLKTARAVMENFQACIRFGSQLESVKIQEQEPRIRENMTQKEKDQAIERQALELGFPKNWNEDLWPRVLNALREARSDNREVYLIDEMLLSKLVKWKKSRKRSGGVKSVTTAGAKKTSKRP